MLAEYGVTTTMMILLFRLKKSVNESLSPLSEYFLKETFRSPFTEEERNCMKDHSRKEVDDDLSNLNINHYLSFYVLYDAMERSEVTASG